MSIHKKFPLDRRPFLCADDRQSIMADLQVTTPIPVGDHPGAFASIRKHDIHTGVDLYSEHGTRVSAIADGIVVDVIPFTGGKTGTDWWCDTDAVIIEDAEGFWLYGEVLPRYLAIGMQIQAGEHIGNVSRVLKNFKGRPTSMLHLERYVKGTKQFAPTWELRGSRPSELIDPTPLLRHFVG